MFIEVNTPFSHDLRDTQMSSPFDSLATARRLEATGIATKQAEAIVFAIQENRDTAVTKRDLDSNVALLRSEMEANTAALRSDIAAMGAELRAEMGKHRGELFRALWIQGAGLVGILLASKIF